MYGAFAACDGPGEQAPSRRSSLNIFLSAKRGVGCRTTYRSETGCWILGGHIKITAIARRVQPVLPEDGLRSTQDGAGNCWEQALNGGERGPAGIIAGRANTAVTGNTARDPEDERPGRPEIYPYVASPVIGVNVDTRVKRSRGSMGRGYPIQEPFYDLLIRGMDGMPGSPAAKTGFDIRKNSVSSDK